MNKILLIIYPLGHLSIALIEWILIGWGIRLWRQSSTVAMIVLPLLLASISYDNLILVIGNLIGAGDLLESLSMVRFLLHYLVVPFFIVIGVELAHGAGAAWATTISRVLSWVIAFGLVGVDVSTNYVVLELKPTYFAGILRYIPANLNGPPIITIIVSVFMVMIGLGIWIRLKWSWLFVGALVALIGNAMPSSTVGTIPGSAAELIMAFSLLLTEQQIQFIDNQTAKNQKQDDRFMAESKPSESAFDWQHIISKEGYKIYQSGSHAQGNFIQVFVPDIPYRDAAGKLRLITYLHGFALCLPKFYQDHLEILAKKGYYVVFPDFQKSFYPDDITNQVSAEKTPLSFWFNILRNVLSKWNKFNLEDALQSDRRTKIGPVVRKLVKPTPFKYLRISLALIVLILLIRLLNRRYGKHLIQLISTVALSLAHSPVEWVQQAIDLTDAAWQKLGQDTPDLAKSEFDFYVFGHSLGGLLSLSWPIYLEENQQAFFPKQIITADPAPSTEMGIPQTVLWILKLFFSPFAQQPINIRKIGSQLTVPIGILHGVDDKIVKPGAWVDRSFWQQSSNFDCIASKQKKIYFSLSNSEDNPPLVAFHNQAVTDTTYFDDALFAKLGGVKKKPNIYNYQYIWSGLDLVVTNQAEVNQLLSKFNQPGSPLVVTDTLPEKPTNFTKIAIALLGGLSLLALGYWFWQSYTLV